MDLCLVPRACDRESTGTQVGWSTGKLSGWLEYDKKIAHGQIAGMQSVRQFGCRVTSFLRLTFHTKKV